MKVNLDINQRNAVYIKEKNVLVVASPGSGKTTVIINRVNHLIEDLKINEGNIIVITFTRAAADNMRNRYKNIFKKERAPFFGTFHGLFYKILLREGYDIKIMDGGKAVNFLGKEYAYSPVDNWKNKSSKAGSAKKFPIVINTAFGAHSLARSANTV